MSGSAVALPQTLGSGRYRLGRRLGEGGTASVVRAVDTTLGVERAIKLLVDIDPSIRATLWRRLQAEARTMARLQHPGVLAVHDIGEEGPIDYIVMDLAREGSIDEVLERDGYLPLPMALSTMIQALSALSAAHAAGIVHRDVKPHNLLLDGGRVLLADFGIALISTEDRRTRAGVAMGSFAYMPHEQRLDASAVGPAADIYAAGATLYHLVTGDSPVDLFLCSNDPDHIRWSALPPLLRPIVQRACALHPTDRYTSADEMASALRALLPLVEHEPDAPAVRAGAADTDPAVRSKTIEESRATEHVVPQIPALGSRSYPQRGARAASAVALIIGLLMPLSFAAWLWSGREPVRPPPALVAPTAIVPVPAPTPATAPAPTPAPALPAPTPAPVLPAPALPAPALLHTREIAPKAAKGEPSPQASALPAPLGAWSGSLNGVRFTLTLKGTPDAVVGQATSQAGSAVEQHPVTGAFNAADRKLVLAEPPGENGRATYTFDLVGERLVGSVDTDGQRRMLSLSRVSP